MLSTDIYQNIPAELREMPNWVAWKKKTVNGRPTKVPYQPNRLRKNDLGRKSQSLAVAFADDLERYCGAPVGGYGA